MTSEAIHLDQARLLFNTRSVLLQRPVINPCHEAWREAHLLPRCRSWYVISMCKQTAGKAAIRCHICRKRRYSTARGATQALCVHHGNSGSPNTLILPGLVNLRGQLEQGRVQEWASPMAALLDFVTPSQSYTSMRATTSIRSVVPKGFLLPLCLELLKCAHLEVSARTHPQLALFPQKYSREAWKLYSNARIVPT